MIFKVQPINFFKHLERKNMTALTQSFSLTEFFLAPLLQLKVCFIAYFSSSNHRVYGTEDYIMTSLETKMLIGNFKMVLWLSRKKSLSLKLRDMLDKMIWKLCNSRIIVHKIVYSDISICVASNGHFAFVLTLIRRSWGYRLVSYHLTWINHSTEVTKFPLSFCFTGKKDYSQPNVSIIKYKIPARHYWI